MIFFVAQAGPPSSPQQLPAAVVGEIWRILQTTLYIVDAILLCAVLVFGALLVLDRDRGESISATSPHMAAFRIVLGALVSSSAVSIASLVI